MSRFDNLEFDDAARLRRDAAAGLGRGTPVRDAAHFMQEGEQDFRAGRLESALKDYSRALECDATLHECWLMQVRILTELGEYKEAGVWADKALELFPESPELLSAKAVAAVRMGMLRQALDYSDNAMSRQGATPLVWLARGEVMLARDSRMAGHCFDQAQRLCTGPSLQGWMDVELARVYRRYGRYSQALLHARSAAGALPQHPAVLMELGYCQRDLGLPDARLSFEQALDLDPRADEAKHALEALDNGTFWSSLRRFFRRVRGK
jgi:tetratricopeptide (TPR) repeat protein